MSIEPKAPIENEPWNKGKAVGQKSPFNPDQAELIRTILRSDHENAAKDAAQADSPVKANKLRRKALGALRDLALFNMAIDTMLRASDLLALRVIDIADHNGEIVPEFNIRQQKTGNPHRVTLLIHTRESLTDWLLATSKTPEDFIFTSVGNRNTGNHLSRNQYANLVKKWAEYARLDPRQHSTHSMRRTKSAAIYDQTLNLAKCQQLLGHKSIANTALYLGIEQREALDLAKKIKV